MTCLGRGWPGDQGGFVLVDTGEDWGSEPGGGGGDAVYVRWGRGDVHEKAKEGTFLIEDHKRVSTHGEMGEVT